MKNNITIRMGAAFWDCTVKGANGKPERSEASPVHFNFRTMDRKGRSDFHRELMNAFRAQRQA